MPRETRWTSGNIKSRFTFTYLFVCFFLPKMKAILHHFWVLFLTGLLLNMFFFTKNGGLFFTVIGGSDVLTWGSIFRLISSICQMYRCNTQIVGEATQKTKKHRLLNYKLIIILFNKHNYILLLLRFIFLDLYAFKIQKKKKMNYSICNWIKNKEIEYFIKW